MDLHIVDARSVMPSCLDVLESPASEEGIKNVSRLIQEWNLGQTLFDGKAECLVLAQASGLTVAIGGLLECKAVPNSLRVSRFYVLPDWRMKGIATAIANHLLSDAREFTEVITCNAQASENAAPFWESLGFISTEIPGITHMLRVNSEPNS